MSSLESSTTLALPLSDQSQPVLEKLALIIPTLREVDNIGVLLYHVISVLDPIGFPFEIVVVDDDSQDGTEAAVNAISKQDPRVRLLIRKGERGLSGAVLYGWIRTDAAILGVMDADLQHPPDVLPKLLAAMREGADLAIGSRYTEGGGFGAWNVFRKFISASATRITWPLQRPGVRATDPMSGLFMVRRACIEQVPLQRAGFKLLLDVLVRGRIRSVKEVPFTFALREKGVSKASLKVGWDYARLLLSLYAEKFGLKRKV